VPAQGKGDSVLTDEAKENYVFPAPAGAETVGYDDLEEHRRGKVLSFIVFWAPALILLTLAGVVIWLVR
jgi:hypothetical protein